MNARRVTIRDVAAAADVSVTTVSDALSGKGRLPELTRARVAETAARLGYRASSAATNLRGGRTGVLLMSVTAPDTDDATSWNVEFFVRVMSGASEYAFNSGYALAMAPLKLSLESARIPCDGVLVVDPTEDNELVRRAQAENLPIVTVGRLAERTHYVDNDIPGGVRQLLDLFEAQGARRPALLTSPLTTSYTADTAATYTAWCAARSVDPLIEIVEGGMAEEIARAAAARLVASASPPDAVLGTLDSIANGALAGVLSAGRRVPADCLIASLADSGSIASAVVPITALDLNPAMLGADAARMLITLVDGRGKIDAPHVIPSILRERASTAGRGGEMRRSAR